MTFIFCLFVVSMSIFSCNNKQIDLQTVANTEPIITLEKERTRGDRAPRYRVEIFKEPVAKYTGLANVSMIGEQLVELEEKEYEAILKQLEIADLKTLNTSYKGGMRDLPLTSISVGVQKITYNQENCPKQLSGLAVALEKIVGDKILK